MLIRRTRTSRPPALARLLAVLAAVLALTGAALTATPASAADPAPSITGVAARSGPLGGGDLVTIRGYHLTGTTSVLFGGTPTSTDLQVISDTHVQVRTPAHTAGGIYVQVVRADATSAPNAIATYVFVAAPAPLKFGPLHRGPGVGGDLDCASATLCASIGVVREERQGHYVYGAVVRNGSTWRSKEFSHYGVNGVSCTLSPHRMCMTVGIDGYASRYDGRAWHRTRVAPASYDHPLVDVSCATSSFCQAITTNGLAYRWNGTRWSGATRIADGRLLSVSCPRTTFCYAVGTTGVRWIGARWVAAHPVSVTGGTAYSVSCSSATFCMAGGRFQGGNRVIFTGVAWSPPNHDHYDFEGMNQTPVTCTGPTFCVNPNGDFETDYHFATYNGDVVNQDKEFLTQISCWAAYRCMSSGGNQWQYVTKGP